MLCSLSARRRRRLMMMMGKRDGGGRGIRIPTAVDRNECGLRLLGLGAHIVREMGGRDLFKTRRRRLPYIASAVWQMHFVYFSFLQFLSVCCLRTCSSSSFLVRDAEDLSECLLILFRGRVSLFMPRIPEKLKSEKRIEDIGSRKKGNKEKGGSSLAKKKNSLDSQVFSAAAA